MRSRQYVRAAGIACALWAGCAFAVQSGTWTARFTDSGALHLSVRTSKSGSNGMQWGTTMPVSEASGLSATPSGPVEFSLSREAGTLTLRGQFEGRQGAGHFEFEESPAFRKQMAALGYPDWDPEEVFIFFSAQAGPARVTGLRALGYRMTKDEVMQVALFNVTPELIREYARVGYPNLPLEDVIKMRIHDIDPAWIERVRGAVPPARR